jgi:hypothetical protein
MEFSRNSIASGRKLLSGVRKKKYKQNNLDDAKSIIDYIKERL